MASRRRLGQGVTGLVRGPLRHGTGGGDAERILELLSHHYHYGRDKMLVIARRKASPAQHKALATIEGAQAPPRRKTPES